MTVELVAHLFAIANNRPNGQRGFFAFYRVGADSVLDGAFATLLAVLGAGPLGLGQIVNI